MEFISNQLDEIKNLAQTNEAIVPLVRIIEKLANQQDLLYNKINELEEINENLAMNLHDVQEIILKNFDLEDCGDETCDCGHCDGDCQSCDDECDEYRPDSFYTLQCPFCEELFFIEKDELDQSVECPFCSKEIKAAENLVKH